MKTENVHLSVGVFRLRVGADVNMLAFHRGSLNTGSVDKISRLLKRYSESPERRSDIGSKQVGEKSTVVEVGGD